VLGYLAPSYLALGTLAACALGAGTFLWSGEPGAERPRAWYLAWFLPVTALALIFDSWPRSSLATFTATDALDELRIRQLPSRALVVDSSPQTVFRGLELSAVEGARPDIVHIPLPFLRYPGATEALSAGQPGLAPLIDSYLAAEDQLRAASLLGALASERSVFVELDTRVDPALYPLLTAGCLYSEVRAVGMTASDFAAYRGALDRCQRYLDLQLGAQVYEAETSRQLLWIHYMNAVQLGALGYTPVARAELQRALRLKPQEQRLLLLDRELGRAARLDPSAFLAF
jgi:hypothetical protein